MNNTPIEWHPKKKSTIETDAYGSEYSSTRAHVEQRIDLCVALRHLKAPLREKSCTFGDNKHAVSGSMTPQSRMRNRHVYLS